MSFLHKVCDRDGCIRYGIYPVVLNVLFLIKITSTIGNPKVSKTKAFICYFIQQLMVTLYPEGLKQNPFVNFYVYLLLMCC